MDATSAGLTSFGVIEQPRRPVIALKVIYASERAVKKLQTYGNNIGVFKFDFINNIR